jgi:hypothetical protein
MPAQTVENTLAVEPASDIFLSRANFLPDLRQPVSPAIGLRSRAAEKEFF